MNAAEEQQKALRWHWLFGWTARFTESWGALPAVPILYGTLLLGAIQVSVFDPIPGGPDDIATEWWASLSWRILSIMSPVLAFIAWWLINRRSGQTRLFGLWLRLAGDLGRWLEDRGEYDDPRIYFTYALTGVLIFVGMLVIRDVWILVQVEEITRELERLAQDSGHEGTG